MFAFFPQMGGQNVYADYQPTTNVKTENQQKKEQLVGRNNFLQVLSSMIYVLLWPLIALAGLLLDNQLIYGSFMQLDVSLWSIWQIVRNFANYALGFVFLIGILMYNLSPKGNV